MAEGRIEAAQKAFDIALKAFGTANGITVALENINAPTSTNTPYLAGFMLPLPIEQADLYFTEMMQGVYQIDINYGSHTGSSLSNRLADKLNLAFKPDTVLNRAPVCITITSFDYGPLIVENGWAKRPVSINYITYTARL